VDDKGSVLDLLVRLADGTVADVEMQVERRSGFRKRALYYWARAFTSQLVRGQEYVRLRPAVLVVFLCYEETAATRLHSEFRVLETHDHQLFSEELGLHLIELPKLGRMTEEEQTAERNLVRWAKFFTARTDEQFIEAAQEDKMVEKVLDYLERLSAKADVRLLAERREMAQLMYRMEQTENRLEAEAKGKAEGKVLSVLTILDVRGIAVPEGVRQRLLACQDSERLDEWLRRSVTAATLDDILG
jgi:predicted transposase/invertase (TIGR01784 family)